MAVLLIVNQKGPSPILGGGAKVQVSRSFNGLGLLPLEQSIVVQIHAGVPKIASDVDVKATGPR